MIQFDKLTKDDLITLCVSFLNLVAKQNYGKAWTSDSEKDGKFMLGIHSPEGEIVAEVPEEYRHHFAGLIEVDEPDIPDTGTVPAPPEPAEGQEVPEGEAPAEPVEGVDYPEGGTPPEPTQLPAEPTEETREEILEPETVEEITAKVWAWSETL